MMLEKIALVSAAMLFFLAASGIATAQESRCTPGEYMCPENQLWKCNAEGTSWTKISNCPNGCLGNACIEKERNSNWIYVFGAFIATIIAIIAVAARKRKNRPTWPGLRYKWGGSLGGKK